LLRQAAGNDIQKRMIAGLIAVSFDWCWKDFITIESDLKDWALDVLAGHVTDMDVETPHVLVKRGKKPIAIKEEMVRFQEVLMSYLESQRFAE
jgi:hypothetical protein